MKRKTSEELELEVGRLKRSCASYKSENTKLRARCTELLVRQNDLSALLENQCGMTDQYREELVKLRSRSWWERFKDLFWFE